MLILEHFCKDPWTNVHGYFIDYFLGTTVEGFVLSHASSSTLTFFPANSMEERKEQVRITDLTPSSRGHACKMRRGGWGHATILSVMPNTAPKTVSISTVRTEHGTTDWFQVGKECVKAVYCHPAYLTYMQSTSWETLGWRMFKLESRLPGEISITSDMQMTPPLWQKVKRS